LRTAVAILASQTGFQFRKLKSDARGARQYGYGDAGRASCRRNAENTLGSQGVARTSGRDTCSMASISIDSHRRSASPDRQPLIC
jgi:hypothetical protein